MYHFRFFEAQVVYVYNKKDNVTGEVLDYTDYDITLEPTPLRTAPIYTAYFNW